MCSASSAGSLESEVWIACSHPVRPLGNNSLSVCAFVLVHLQVQPGLMREPGFAGPGLEVEVWALPADAFGRFVADIPAPLGVGKIALEDGSVVTGFLCEAYALAGAEEITGYGGWRGYLAQRAG